MQINFIYNKISRLSFLDIFSLTGNVKIQGKDSYSYFLSLILSLLSLITIVGISTYFILNTFKRKSVSVVFNVDSMVYPVVNLTEFPMTVALYNSFGHILPEQERIFYITARYWTFKTDFDENNQPYISNKIYDIQLEKCNIDQHFGEYKRFFENTANLGDKYCLPPYSLNMTIYGKYGDTFNGFSFFSFLVRKCINGQDGKINCKDIQQIDDILKMIHMEFTHIDYEIDHNNPEDPKVITRKADLYQLSSTIYRKINKYISPVVYTSDYGYIFEKIDISNFFQDERDEVEIDLRKEGVVNGSFSSLVLLNSSKTQKYNREFVKLQTLLASIGGIINGITVIMKIIRFIFARNLLNFVLFRSLFDILEDSGKTNLKEQFKTILQKTTESLPNNSENDFQKIKFNSINNLIKINRSNLTQKNIM